MAKQYNIDITGSLTNTDGILSGFSLTNYATLPTTFNPRSGNNWEIVLKVKTGASFSGNDTILCRTKNSYYGLRIQRESSSGHIYVGISTNGTSTSGNITGTTVLQINTTYWIKVTYNGSNQYALLLSTDGVNYASEGSANISGSIYNDTTNPTYLGVHTISTDRIWNGTIDLNECYIKINGALWWRGVDNITKIQLRHDTAANWTSVNPVLLEGEVGIETDTKKQKIGDGSTPWNNLAYDLGSTALQRLDADGQPVAVDQLLTTSTSVGSYNIDISSYLPNDSYDYEIILNGEIYNSNSTYGQVWLGSSKSTTIIVSNVGTNKRLSTILAPLVVSTNREITMQIAGHSIEWQNVNNRQGLYLVSYRRLGTNS